MATTLWSIALVIAMTFVGTFGALFFKLGSKDFSFNPLKLLRNYNLIIGFLLYGISATGYVVALKGGELSILYPLVSVAYVWVSIISVKFLGEKMTTSKVIGIAIIILGVSLVGIG